MPRSILDRLPAPLVNGPATRLSVAAQLSRSERIYLVAPYTHVLPGVQARRAQQIGQAAAALFEGGALVFSPICHGEALVRRGREIGLDLGTDAEAWKDHNAAWLEAAGSVFLLDLPGWKESRGVAFELGLALDRRKPIRKVAPVPVERERAVSIVAADWWASRLRVEPGSSTKWESDADAREAFVDAVAADVDFYVGANASWSIQAREDGPDRVLADALEAAGWGWPVEPWANGKPLPNPTTMRYDHTTEALHVEGMGLDPVLLYIHPDRA